MESSPTSHTPSVGVSGLSPESVTSSTVSPIESTSVALTNDTTMNESCSSAVERLTVHTAFGLPGSSETAISLTASPCCTTRSDERAPRPHSVTRAGGAPRCSSSSLASSTGESEAMSSTWQPRRGVLGRRPPWPREGGRAGEQPGAQKARVWAAVTCSSMPFLRRGFLMRRSPAAGCAAGAARARRPTRRPRRRRPRSSTPRRRRRRRPGTGRSRGFRTRSRRRGSPT